MIRVESPQDQVYVAKVYEAKQEQIFRYWDELNPEARRGLLAQIASLDFQEFSRLVRHGFSQQVEEEGHQRISALEPVEMIDLPTTPLQQQERARARAAGLEALRRGEVGVFLVAGGQGTRLGFDGPKGCYSLLPISGASLFQHFAEKILALGRAAKKQLPWYIMTSQANDGETREFFRSNRNFGLAPSDVHFCPQAMLPVIDPRLGRILMASRGELLLSPNGHGGAVRVMQGLKGQFAASGIKFLFYHQVDNPLVQMADPVFLGYHIIRDAQFSSKAVAKTEPGERVGIFCVDAGHTRVVEYTEIGEEEQSARDPDGQLTYRAGNIATHVISTDYVAPDDATEPFVMPYHIARKAVRYLRDGELVEGNEPNSVRFESFIFDVLPSSRNPVVLEAMRSREFAPVKNASGVDSPESSRKALVEQWAQWLEEAGIEIPRGRDGHPQHLIEISPLVADSAESLARVIDNYDIDPDRPIHLR